MQKLFVYGSLQPGKPNAHILAEIDGFWEPAVAKGRLIQQGWGSEMGYPALVLAEEGEEAQEVHGHLFSSSDLAGSWSRIDEFEGGEYRRTTATVRLSNGDQVQAFVYVLREDD